MDQKIHETKLPNNLKLNDKLTLSLPETKKLMVL